MLDFVNDLEEILEEFKVYFKIVELLGVLDFNFVYDIMDKLNSVGIYIWLEVERFVEVYNDKKVN